MSFTVIRIQGDTYPIVINIRKGASPFDLTGTTVTLSIATSIPASPSETVASMNATSIENSRATFAITNEIANLDEGEYYAQIRITDTNNYVWTPLQFPWRVKPQL